MERFRNMIHKGFFLTFLFLGVTISGCAQNVQKGVVKEYRGTQERQPLSNVEIVVHNASSEISDGKGEFTLSFLTLKPGDRIRYKEIRKSGYEVFNRDALNSWRMSSDNTPFVVLLCKTNEIRRLKDLYESNFNKNYKSQRIKALNEQRRNKQILESEYRQKLKEIDEDYKRRKKNIEEYIDQYIHIDLGTLSSDELEIRNLVDSNRTKLAMAKYDSLALIQKYISADSAVAKLTVDIARMEAQLKSASERRDTIATYLANERKTRLLIGGEENYNRVKDILKAMADADTTQQDNVERYVDFCRDQGFREEADRYLGKLPLDSTTMKALEKRGRVKMGVKDYQTAEMLFRRALLNGELLLQNDSVKNAEPVRSSMFKIYTDLAQMSTNTGDYEDALENYIKADSVCNILETRKPGKYVVQKAESYNNIGLLYDNMGQTDDAIAYYQKSEALLSKIILKSNERKLHKARLDYFLGRACVKQNENLEDALTRLKSAEQIYEEFWKINPNANRISLLDVIYQEAMLYRNQAKYSLALEEIDKCINISPEYWVYHVFKTRTYHLMGETSLAQKEYQNILKCDSSFAERFPNSVLVRTYGVNK